MDSRACKRQAEIPRGSEGWWAALLLPSSPALSALAPSKTAAHVQGCTSAVGSGPSSCHLSWSDGPSLGGGRGLRAVICSVPLSPGESHCFCCDWLPCSQVAIRLLCSLWSLLVGAGHGAVLRWGRPHEWLTQSLPCCQGHWRLGPVYESPRGEALGTNKAFLWGTVPSSQTSPPRPTSHLGL